MQASPSIKYANLPVKHPTCSQQQPCELAKQTGSQPPTQAVSQTFSCIIVFLINQRHKQKASGVPPERKHNVIFS